MMRYLLVLPVLFLACSAIRLKRLEPTEESKSSCKSEVEEFYAYWNELYRLKDVDRFLEKYADEAILLPPGAPLVNGKSEIRPLVAQEFERGAESTVITLQDIILQCRRKYVTRYTGVRTFRNGTSINISGVRVMKKKKGKLWIKLEIWNRDGEK